MIVLTDEQLITVWIMVTSTLNEYRTFAGLTSEENRSEYESCHRIHEKVLREIRLRNLALPAICTGNMMIHTKERQSI